MHHETTRKSKIEQVTPRRSACEAKNTSRRVRNEKHRFRPWGNENREMDKNDEFKHVKRAPLSTFNEKTAVELTTLFLYRFQSLEAQNRPFATDVRFPYVKLTFVSPQNWIFNGNWTPMGGDNHGLAQSLTPGNMRFPRQELTFNGF